MKNLLVALFVLVAFSASSFADVNDNSGSTKQGTGSFKCTVLTPLTIDSPTQVDLGEFVAAPSNPYTVTNAITFTVGGEANHPYFYSTSAVNANTSIATFVGSWDATYSGTSGTKTLDGTGANTHVYTLSSLTALASGVAVLNLTVNVSYNSF